MLLIAGLIATVYAVKAGVKEGIDVKTIIPLVAGSGLLVWFGRLQVSSSSPMLDLSLLLKPAIAVGLMMAFVASGALAGFELVLAQELQFVLGKSPLAAGLFMLPLVIAAAVGGPVGGTLSHYFGLRHVATFSMAGAALALAGIAMVDFDRDVYLVAGLLAILGFSLGVGLLASSVAIMGSAPVEKAGAAGALESSGYELGGGLGITFFGVLVNSMYRASFNDSLAVVGSVTDSIGEAMTVAGKIGGSQGEAIRQAARTAFADAHGSVLLLTALLIALLSVAVFWSLRSPVQFDPARH
jgi:DHA2 family multidrug resistance protein-like MFS transporter